jgi:organic radical activating enzyme
MLNHLETNITTACQLSCRDCNHFIPIQKASFIEVEQLEKDLNKLAKITKAQAYALIGGEPLIHPDIVELLYVSRASGISDCIEVWTNGLLIKRMPDEFWMGLDKLVLSIYPGKEQHRKYIEDKCAEYSVDLEVKDGLPFTAVLHKSPDRERAKVKWARCWYRNNLFVVDNGYLYRCCTSPFIPKLILGLPEGVDGIALEELTEDSLRNFVNRKEPMQSCSICGGHDGPRREWKEVDQKTWREQTEI